MLIYIDIYKYYCRSGHICWFSKQEEGNGDQVWSSLLTRVINSDSESESEIYLPCHPRHHIDSQGYIGLWNAVHASFFIHGALKTKDMIIHNLHRFISKINPKCRMNSTMANYLWRHHTQRLLNISWWKVWHSLDRQ